MTITATLYQSNTHLNQAFGAHFDDAAQPAAKTISVGFMPRKVRYLNATDSIEFEWLFGMAATKTLKTVANGTRTLDTGTAITVSEATATLDSDLNLKPTQTKATYVVTIAGYSSGAGPILQNKQGYFEIVE
jgi:hypothetical protein